MPILLLAGLMGYALFHLTNVRPVPEAGNSTTPCPAMQQQVRASEVNLRPGLDRHHNWVAFSVPATFSGHFAFCLDHDLLYSSSGSLIFPEGAARFNVSTSWVNVQYLRGALDQYRAEARWQLGLTCESRQTC